MASFENTVTIRRPVEDVVPGRLRERPQVERRNRRDHEGVPWPGGGRNDLPADPVGAESKRRGLRGDGLRAGEPTRGAGSAGAVHGQGELPARADGQRDEAYQRCGSWVLGSADPGGVAGDLPGQACGGGQPRHAEAAPGEGWPTWCRITRSSLGTHRTGWLATARIGGDALDQPPSCHAPTPLARLAACDLTSHRPGTPGGLTSLEQSNGRTASEGCLGRR
jgi:hypothetical protein